MPGNTRLTVGRRWGRLEYDGYSKNSGSSQPCREYSLENAFGLERSGIWKGAAGKGTAWGAVWRGTVQPGKECRLGELRNAS